MKSPMHPRKHRLVQEDRAARPGQDCPGALLDSRRAAPGLPAGPAPSATAAVMEREGGTRLLVEDYAERVKGCAQYLTRLLADQGTRVDNPVDEPIGPEESTPLDLGWDPELVQFG